MGKEEVILIPDEDGTFYKPYATYYCKTKEDAKELQLAIEKQMPKRILRCLNGEEHCPSCEINLTGMGFKYCVECGQRLGKDD